ncbi:hypothetical protein ACOMDM_25745 (plasmid) [Serratia plymuthica]|uniref:hypothetical protein n=1 Tax=Enterobacterales TaxID=91347 RepID=UPI001C592F7A|nr:MULTISPECIES: hypothetical protein [Enterobacterales]WEO92588.1 hypothetical protein JET59_027955 [Serratia proteamaculans]
MGTLTIRTQAEHDTALVAVGNRLGEKTASQTLLKSLMTYERHCEEIERLRRELSAMKWERDELRGKIEDYKRAHNSLLAL